MMEFIKQELNRRSVFLDESKLSMDFIPELLIHRDEESKQLACIFKPLLTSRNFISKNVIVIGSNGSGKTALTKSFGHSIEVMAKDFEKKIHYMHINCRLNRSNYIILKSIIRRYSLNLPEKGFSIYELVAMLKKVLDANDMHLILTLDEMSFLDTKHDNLIYMLNRLNEHELEPKSRISVIGIEKNLNFIQHFDLSTLSTFQYNIVPLKTYTTNQVYDILRARATLSLKEDAYTNDVLKFIAEIGSRTADMRYTLEILYKAGKYADHNEYSSITSECIRYAQSSTFDNFDSQSLSVLSPNEKIILLAVCRGLKHASSSNIPVSTLQQEYRVACEEFNVQPVKRSQFYLVLNRLKDLEFISIHNPVSKSKGDQSTVTIEKVPVNLLEREIIKLL